MRQYAVTGMSCAACSARVEKAVSKVPGVDMVSVSLLTNSMGVEGSASDAAIIQAVTDAGYGAQARQAGKTAGSANAAAGEDLLKDHDTPVLKRRLISSIVFLVLLMYLSMGHMMLGWPLPAFMADNHVMMGLVQLVLTTIIMVINQKFFINGYKSLFHRAPNMDTLVALGASAAYLYSLWALFAMTDAQVKMDMDAVMGYMREFYFESAAMILTLITVGKMLEARSKGKTTDALKSLMRLAPKTATLVTEGTEMTIPIDQVKKGDLFVVRPGENIPVDGIVIEGTSAVNEAALTGESIPVDKAAGDPVSAATTNQSGFLKCEAVRVGQDTTLSQIIRMVSDAAATKAPIAKIADKVSGIFVPAVIAIAIITFIVWMLIGVPIGTALTRAVAVLVISCPCALGLATPVAIMVGNGMGAKNGILFKTAVSLEETGKTAIVVLDKTGTITAGMPEVTDLLPAEGYTQEELLRFALALEQKSEHPLARAVLKRAEACGLAVEEVEDFKALPGNGLSALLAGQTLVGGSFQFISETIAPSQAVRSQAERLAGEGKTPLLFAKDGTFLGIIAVADVIKEDSPAAIRQLQKMGLYVIMLTGDNEKTANAIGAQAGVDEVIAGVLPDGKESVIRRLQEKAKVIMVGDGINDAPALTRADIGIAIGAGADVAVDAADIVLMKSRLSDVPAAIRLSRATLRSIHQNLFWAFIYNVIGIPLAAGVFISLLGWQLNPMFGAAAMSLSSFCVVTNALRLNLFALHDASKDKPRKNRYLPDAAITEEPVSAADGNEDRTKDQKEDQPMEKTLKIEGMMCGHCEARVKKALEAVEGVKEAVVSHEAGTAVVSFESEVADDVLKAAVEAQDYPVLEITA